MTAAYDPRLGPPALPPCPYCHTNDYACPVGGCRAERERALDDACVVWALLKGDEIDPDTPENRLALVRARERFAATVEQGFDLSVYALEDHLRRNAKRILDNIGAGS